MVGALQYRPEYRYWFRYRSAPVSAKRGRPESAPFVGGTDYLATLGYARSTARYTANTCSCVGWQ